MLSNSSNDIGSRRSANRARSLFEKSLFGNILLQLSTNIIVNIYLTISLNINAGSMSPASTEIARKELHTIIYVYIHIYIYIYICIYNYYYYYYYYYYSYYCYSYYYYYYSYYYYYYYY